MSNLVITNSVKTPSIELSVSGFLEIKGKSIPENSFEFYKPVYEWLDNYLNFPAPKTELKVSLEYFNTSSSKCLLDIFRKLETINLSGKSEVKVQWYYDADDEDMMEAGEDYQALVKIPFELNKI
jgi:SiaC family regulatory phosphoprotein